MEGPLGPLGFRRSPLMARRPCSPEYGPAAPRCIRSPLNGGTSIDGPLRLKESPSNEGLGHHDSLQGGPGHASNGPKRRMPGLQSSNAILPCDPPVGSALIHPNPSPVRQVSETRSVPGIHADACQSGTRGSNRDQTAALARPAGDRFRARTPDRTGAPILPTRDRRSDRPRSCSSKFPPSLKGPAKPESRSHDPCRRKRSAA